MGRKYSGNELEALSCFDKAYKRRLYNKSFIIKPLSQNIFLNLSQNADEA